MHALRKKSKYATEEPFVFIKFNADNGENDEQCSHLAKIIELKTSGNELFKTGRYGDAISSYTKAIALLKSQSKKSAHELANCYQNRAAAYEMQGNYPKCIEDAGKAIAVNDVYAKAYYRRAKGYAAQRRYYAAMQDVMQACILEQFRNEAYNNMAAEICLYFENSRGVNHGLRAYDELKCSERECDHCNRENFNGLKASTILSPVMVPVDESAPNTDFNYVMRAIIKGDTKAALKGCTELTSAENTNDINYYRAVVLQVHIRLSTSRQMDMIYADLQLLNKVLNRPFPAEMREPLILSRARTYARMNMQQQADDDLCDVEKANPLNPHIYVIRSCILDGLDCDNTKKMAALDRCCRMMPKFFLAHSRLAYAHFHRFNNIDKFFKELHSLMERFPNNLESAMLLVGAMIGHGQTAKAKSIFERVTKKIPNDPQGFTHTTRGLLKPTDPSSVRYFKKSIEESNAMDTRAFRALFDYYAKTSFEYAKAFEVINRALMVCNEKDDLEEMFDERQSLLRRVIKQDFWGKL